MKDNDERTVSNIGVYELYAHTQTLYVPTHPYFFRIFTGVRGRMVVASRLYQLV